MVCFERLLPSLGSLGFVRLGGPPVVSRSGLPFEGLGPDPGPVPLVSTPTPVLSAYDPGVWYFRRAL